RAVRVALGSVRTRIVRQLMTESLLLSVSGSVLGVALAYAAARALMRIILSGRALPGIPPLHIDVIPDGQVLLFAPGMAVGPPPLFGLAPPWGAFAAPPASSLRVTGAAEETRGKRLFGR